MILTDSESPSHALSECLKILGFKIYKAHKFNVKQVIFMQYGKLHLLYRACLFLGTEQSFSSIN